MGWGPVEWVGDQLTGWEWASQNKNKKINAPRFLIFWIRATVAEIEGGSPERDGGEGEEEEGEEEEGLVLAYSSSWICVLLKTDDERLP